MKKKKLKKELHKLKKRLKNTELMLDVCVNKAETAAMNSAQLHIQWDNLIERMPHYKKTNRGDFGT